MQGRVAASRQPQRSSATNIGWPPLDQCHSHWPPSRPDARGPVASRAFKRSRRETMPARRAFVAGLFRASLPAPSSPDSFAEKQLARRELASGFLFLPLLLLANVCANVCANSVCRLLALAECASSASGVLRIVIRRLLLNRSSSASSALRVE